MRALGLGRSITKHNKLMVQGVYFHEGFIKGNEL